MEDRTPLAESLEDCASWSGGLSASGGGSTARSFRDLLKKHGRPTTLKEMLQASARSHPANDPRPPRKQRSS